jgi:4-amino-4-deoxy-L-arabinose transferase-like glycosyltransferase
MTIIRHHFGLIAALILAIGLKTVLLAMDVVPFNADEAVVALMAKHILQGERPVFFYGQAYLGSTDAWLIAGAFLFLGQTVLAVRIVQVLLYLGTIATTYILGVTIYGSRWAATVAALLLSLPPVLVTLYTTATLGGYGETLLLGNILLLWSLRLREKNRRWFEWLAFGTLAGFGFYTFGFLGVYLLPIGLALAWSRMSLEQNAATFVRALISTPALALPLVALLGFLMGSSPWWLATMFGAATLSELGGSAIAGAAPVSPLVTIGLRLLGLILLGPTAVIGLRPPWGIVWLGLPLAPLALVLFFASLGWAIKASQKLMPGRLLLGILATVSAAFLLTPFGNDPSGRYFLPFAPVLALFAAGFLHQLRASYPRLAISLVAGLMAFHLWGNVQSALTFPPGITTQFDQVAQVNQRDLPRVIEFLKAHGETRGYTNYWVSFPMAFLSNEQLVFTASLPYHEDLRYTSRDNRYAPYQDLVSTSDRVAYVTSRHPALDTYLRESFAALNIQFNEISLGDFRVFYNLSRKVTPVEMGLANK